MRMSPLSTDVDDLLAGQAQRHIHRHCRAVQIEVACLQSHQLYYLWRGSACVKQFHTGIGYRQLFYLQRQRRYHCHLRRPDLRRGCHALAANGVQRVEVRITERAGVCLLPALSRDSILALTPSSTTVSSST